MNIRVGDEVMVVLDAKDKIPNNPVRKYDGKILAIKKTKTLYRGNSGKRIFALCGAESEAGISFWFTESEIIKVEP